MKRGRFRLYSSASLIIILNPTRTDISLHLLSLQFQLRPNQYLLVGVDGPESYCIYAVMHLSSSYPGVHACFIQEAYHQGLTFSGSGTGSGTGSSCSSGSTFSSCTRAQTTAVLEGAYTRKELGRSSYHPSCKIIQEISETCSFSSQKVNCNITSCHPHECNTITRKKHN